MSEEQETPDPKFFGVRKCLALMSVSVYLLVELWLAWQMGTDYEIQRLKEVAGFIFALYFIKRTMENGE